MGESSRSKAYTWPYPRRRSYDDTVRQAASSWFASKGYQVNPKTPYLLAHWKDWPNNIILPEVADYIAEEKQRRETIKGFPLHKYVHHGLSSQAMLFNLIGPLILREDLTPLEMVFRKANISWPEGDVTADLEFENRQVFNEDSGQPTSIDLIIQDAQGAPKIFVEAKFVETEFGGCSVFAAGDCDGRNPARNFASCYLHHIGRRYWDLMEKYGFLTGSLGNDSTCIFTLHYQFFREVLFALELGGSFVLLSDERNPTFICDGPLGKHGLMPFLLSFVPENLRNRVAMVSIQQVVEAIKESGRYEWISDFDKKYGLS